MKKILVVDDSALMRSMISDIIEKETDVCVADNAENGYAAMQLLDEGKQYDLILLDINMPKMNGIRFLEQLNRCDYKIPVLLVSSIASHGAAETMRALELGAFDFVKKPGGVNGASMEEFRKQLTERVHWAFRVNQKLVYRKQINTHPEDAVRRHRETAVTSMNQEKLIFIASSTGGPKALQSVIPMIPGNIGCPIVVVQHMPEGFTGSLAERLDEISPCRVEQAEDGDILKNGIVYLAKGGFQLRIGLTERNQHQLSVKKDAPRNGLRPCADIFLESLAHSGYKKIYCAVLTGMGSDATKGLLQLKRVKDVYTVGQSEKTCVVYGMPRAAAQAGVVDDVADLTDVADLLVKKAR